jgi:acetyltransferase-like isoleucine patch superfamily enzyme
MKINDEGFNNIIEIDDSVILDEFSSITIKGNNNTVRIGYGTVLINAHIIMESDNNSFIVENNCRISGRYFQKRIDGNVIKIGEYTTFGTVHIICGEGRTVTIGRDCMLAFDISIRTTDSHAIVDANNGEQINKGKDISIGNHVWIAAHAVLLKGTILGDNSVVGMKSLVTSRFLETGVVIAGIPAKIIKKGITWTRPELG